MYYSNLLAVLIALTAAVPFLQLDHERNFSLIVESTQTVCSWKEFSLDHFNLLTERAYAIIEK